MAETPAQVWANSPSTTSPISAARLNVTELRITEVAARATAIEADYTTTAEATSLAVALAIVLGG